MKKINLKSTQIQNNFRLFRIKVPNDKLLEVKDLVMSKMNEYLEENEGKLINVKIIKNSEICCFFVTGPQKNSNSWETHLKNDLLKEFNVVPIFLELSPKN